MQLRQPVNKFPELVHYIVQRLKRFCPAMGKVKIAQTLARVGLHLGSTTVGRMLKEKRRHFQPPAEETDEPAPDRVVTAKYPNHVWHVDLTAVPTGLGYWCPWLPFALPQYWPFCWWVAVVVDHFSRARWASPLSRISRHLRPCGPSWAERLPRSKRRLGTSSVTVAVSSTALASVTGADASGSSGLVMAPWGNTAASQS